jgi:hypothetical protein
LAYYDLYPREIDARIEEEESWTPERLYREFPFVRPYDAQSPGEREA